MYYVIFAIPLIVTAISVYYKRKFDIKEIAIQFFASWAIGFAVILIGSMVATSDYEIINGQVNDKTRVHDYWLESYSCNCVEVCSGSGKSKSCSQSCQTCYTDHYTVDWDVKCSVGNVKIKSLDREYKSVYNEPDPAAYTKAYKGEFCATTNTFTNYIKAAEKSLFNVDNKLDYSGYKVPAYPRIHGYYKVNRVFGFGKLNKELNKLLNDKLRTLGAIKQANIILIGSEYDMEYRYAVEQKWLGGKKNDVIVLVGMQNNLIDWIDTITLGSNLGNELMTVKMHDDIMALKTVSTDIAGVIGSTIEKHFDRKPMQEFEYLKDDIQPSIWLIIASILLCVGCNIGIFIYFRKQNTNRTSYYSWRR